MYFKIIIHLQSGSLCSEFKRNHFLKLSNFFRKTPLSLYLVIKTNNSGSSDFFVLYGCFFIEKRINFFVSSLFLIHLRKMIIQNKRKFASILFVLISFVCTAQDTPPPPIPPPPPGLAIDGFVLFVLVLGLIYGIKKRLEFLK